MLLADTYMYVLVSENAKISCTNKSSVLSDQPASDSSATFAV